MKKRTLILVVLALGILALTACRLIPTPEPTPVPTPLPTPTPKPIQYLIIKDGERAPVWPEPGAQVPYDAYLHAGDTVPVRAQLNWEGALWYEVLCGDLWQFDPGTVGWVKYKADKMYLEWRQP